MSSGHIDSTDTDSSTTIIQLDMFQIKDDLIIRNEEVYDELLERNDRGDSETIDEAQDEFSQTGESEEGSVQTSQCSRRSGRKSPKQLIFIIGIKHRDAW